MTETNHGDRIGGGLLLFAAIVLLYGILLLIGTPFARAMGFEYGGGLVLTVVVPLLGAGAVTSLFVVVYVLGYVIEVVT